MIDVALLLEDKVTWKICESVRLGLNTIYLKYKDIDVASAEFSRGRSEGLYLKFSRSAMNIYKFTLTDTVMKDYRENILPFLPEYWWTKHQPWVTISNA